MSNPPSPAGASRRDPSSRMEAPRPKLWIIGPGPSPELQRLLSGAYEVSAYPPRPLAELGPGDRPNLLVVAPEDLRKLTAAPAAAAALLDSMGQGVCLARPNGDVAWSNTKFLA